MAPIIKGNSIYIGDCVIWKGVLDWERRNLDRLLERFGIPEKKQLLSLHDRQHRWQCNYCGQFNLHEYCKACHLIKGGNAEDRKLMTIYPFR